MPLILRQIGIRDYSVHDDGQRVGRIRYTYERAPGVWLWDVQVHITGGLPKGTAIQIETAKAEFKAAWDSFNAKHSPEQLAAAYKAMNIRGRA